MATRFRLPVEALLDTNVIALAGGSITFYLTETTTLQTVYSDDDLTIPVNNPYTLDSVGQHGDIFLGEFTYRVIVKNAAGSIVPGGDIDPVHGSGAAVLTAVDIMYTAPGTGAVARTVTSRLSDIISVKDFNATWDGAADDTAELQAAADAVGAAGGGILLLPEGTGKISATIALSSHTHVMGAGMGATTITCADGDISIFQASSKSNVVISDLTIHGTGAGTASQIGGIKFLNSNNCHAQRVEIKGVSWAGVLIMGTSSYCSVTDCYMHDWLGTTQDSADVAIYSSTGVPVYNLVSNNRLFGGGWHGVLHQNPASAFSPIRNTISFNQIGQHLAYGILDYQTTDVNSYTQIIGNYVENIQGAVLGGTAGAGIYVVGAGGVVIADNHIHNCCVATTTKTLTPAGIGFNGPSSDLQPVNITGNIISGMSKFMGIHIVNGSTNVNLIGNGIDMPAANTSGYAAILIEIASNVRIEGNTIRNRGAGSGPGIFCYANGASMGGIAISGNTIIGFEAKITFDRTAAFTISDVVVSSNNLRSGTANICLALNAVNYGSVTGNLLHGASNTGTVAQTDSTNVRYSNNVVTTSGTVGLLFTNTNTGSRWDLSNSHEGQIQNTGTGMVVEFRTAAIPAGPNSFALGDRGVLFPPAVGQPKAWSNTAAGTPGTMTSEGNL